MRIANSNLSKRRLAALGAAFVIALGGWHLLQAVTAQADPMPGMAADPSASSGAMPSSPSLPVAMADASSSSSPFPSAPAAPPAAPALMPPAAAPASAGLMLPSPSSENTEPAPMRGQTNSEIGKSISQMEEKASSNARDVVKRLDSSPDSMTMEDLNSARQAVARLDAMIDVEKRLAELEKVRGAGGNSSSHSLAAAIPASALAPMPSTSPAAAPAPAHVVEKEKPKSGIAGIEVSRIVGADGKYSAVLKMPGGEMKPVRPGDVITDHATVRWISSSTVLVEEYGETHTLRIKNVNAIFSAMR